MTHTETLLLQLVERHLRRWYCPNCSTVWLTGRTDRALFHRCPAIPTAPRWDPRTTRERADAERIAWAKTALGAAFEDAADPDSLLRELDDDE